MFQFPFQRILIKYITEYDFDNDIKIKTPFSLEKKEEIWLSPMTKASTPTEKSKKATWQHEKSHQKLRLHNDCGPTWDGQLE